MSNTIMPPFRSPIFKTNPTARAPKNAQAVPLFQGGSDQSKAESSAPANKPSTNKPNADAYESPRPLNWLISMLNPVNKYLILSGIPGLRALPLVNQLPGVQGLLNVQTFDLPKADEARLKKALNSDTVAFIGPNHPEFMTDWAIDKKLTSQFAPETAHWADASIVNSSPLAKRFYLANNVIANNGREKAKDDSVQWALKGKSVLLHPEGRVWWHGDKIHPLFPGIVEMSVEAAKQAKDTDKPVYIVPIAWKFHYPTDVSKGLHRDMADLEEKFKLPTGKDLSVGPRFFRLHQEILTQQEKRFGLHDSNKSLPYFKRQQQFQQFLTHKLESKYGKQPGVTQEAKQLNLEKAVHRAKRAEPSSVTKADAAMLKELFRLEGFSAELYHRPYLTQEQLYENIKRSMQVFFGGMKTTLPKPAGNRIIHIRVAEPVNIKAQMEADLSPEAQAALNERLLKQVHQGLQGKLDEVNAEIEPSVREYQVKNEFFTPIKARL